MTAINFSIAGKVLTASQKATLVDRITEAFTVVEVGNDAPAIRRGFMTRFEQLDSDDLWIGTEPAIATSPGKCAILITVRVMAGPWTNAMKAELFSRVERICREELELPREGRGDDFWMTFLEVPEGGWGLGGRFVSIGAIAPVFTEDRQERIRTYLASLT